MTRCCPIVELRQYTLHPGQRDALIELFDREFVESQEALGIHVIGQFRDLDDPDRFVWLRGFESMTARGEALTAFYGGPVWKAHREAANATMLDSDNVLLLHPTGAVGGFDLDGFRHDASAQGNIVVATIHYLDAGAASDFASFFDTAMRSRITAPVLATWPPRRARTASRACPCGKASTSSCGSRGFRARRSASRHRRRHALGTRPRRPTCCLSSGAGPKR
jgi:quinol monooxygenase YgiN